MTKPGGGNFFLTLEENIIIKQTSVQKYYGYFAILFGSGEMLLIELIILSFPLRIIIVSYLAEYQPGREGGPGSDI